MPITLAASSLVRISVRLTLSSQRSPSSRSTFSSQTTEASAKTRIGVKEAFEELVTSVSPPSSLCPPSGSIADPATTRTDYRHPFFVRQARHASHRRQLADRQAHSRRPGSARRLGRRVVRLLVPSPSTSRQGLIDDSSRSTARFSHSLFLSYDPVTSFFPFSDPQSISMRSCPHK